MKTMIRILVGAVVVLVVLMMRQPDQIQVARTQTLDAPVSEVFSRVNTLSMWADWSPWATLDPEMVTTYDGPPAGVGASSHWSGNREVGEGRMTITESRPDNYILIHLEFIKPFTSESMSEFIFTPEGDRTAVTWTMIGENGLMNRLFGVFMDFDAMIGAQYEVGLSNLNRVVRGEG